MKYALTIFRRTAPFSVVLAAVAAFFVSSAQGALYVAGLNGANENPPTSSTAFGVASVSLDTTTHTLIINVTASDLTVGPTFHIPLVSALHINCCVAPPGNVGDATHQIFPLLFHELSGGTFSMTFDTLSTSTWHTDFLAANGGTPAAAEAALAAGLAGGRAYVNITTTLFPFVGEIRGFLTSATSVSSVVPTLSQWSLGFLAAALVAATGFVLRRRQQSTPAVARTGKD